jgi:membrane-associated phospholipid phosphatase
MGAGSGSPHRTRAVHYRTNEVGFLHFRVATYLFSLSSRGTRTAYSFLNILILIWHYQSHSQCQCADRYVHIIWLFVATYKPIVTWIQGNVRSFIHSVVCLQCDLVLPLWISSFFSFPEGHPVAAYVSFVVFPSFISFPRTFLQSPVLESSFYARCDQSS